MAQFFVDIALTDFSTMEIGWVHFFFIVMMMMVYSTTTFLRILQLLRPSTTSYRAIGRHAIPATIALSSNCRS